MVVEVTKKGLKFYGTNSLVVYADYVNSRDEDMYAIESNTDASSVDSKDICLEVNVKSGQKNVGKNTTLKPIKYGKVQIF